ncbi:GNAT family N-acetyltransferase [Saccharothrix syringae]|nr:GNAT family protein [Saccharothrix syringae]
MWVGERVRLRGVEPEDWEAFMRFSGHSGDMRAVDRVYPPRSAAGHREWALARATAATGGDEFTLAVEAGGVVVGRVSTHNADQRAGRFGYGIGIGHEYQRRGYAAEAVGLLLDFMFAERRYHKCEAGVYAFNGPSLALHRKLGFREEGRLRDHEFSAGRHHDMVLFGVLADEWLSPRRS